MKKIFKKTIAIIEVAAMTLALVAGLSISTSKNVKAADGELTVNEAVAISAEAGESVTYTFTAPADDTYYFTTKGDSDTIGRLYIDGEEVAYGDDQDNYSYNLNFLISYELEENQTCTIEVYGYIDEEGYIDGDGSIDCDLVVYDTEVANTIVAGVEPTEEYGEYYCSPGEDITLGVIIYSLLDETIDPDESGYTFEWDKTVIDEEGYEETIGLEETGSTYTIENVTAEDFYGQENMSVVYSVSLYKDDELVGSTYFTISDKADYIDIKNAEYYVSVGDKVVLEPKAYDYDGNEIDLSGEEYTFEWYNSSDYEICGTDITYTIDSVSSSDICDEVAFYYAVDIYKNDEYWCSAYFYLYNNDDTETTTAPVDTETTTAAPSVAETTVTPTTATTEKVTGPAKAKVKKATKKKATKKVKLTLKKITSAAGYQIKVYKTKKNAKKDKKAIVKKFSTKVKVTVKSKKLKNKKKLFVRVRAYVLDANGTKVYGKWSKVKKVNIK